MLVDENPEHPERLREQLLHARYTVIAEVGNMINLHQQVKDLEPDAIIIGTDMARREIADGDLVKVSSRPGSLVLLRAAHSHAPSAELIEQLDALFQMADNSQTINYQDARRGISKRIVVEKWRADRAAPAGRNAGRSLVEGGDGTGQAHR